MEIIYKADHFIIKDIEEIKISHDDLILLKRWLDGCLVKQEMSICFVMWLEKIKKEEK
jgi:hypothetical protein